MYLQTGPVRRLCPRDTPHAFDNGHKCCESYRRFSAGGGAVKKLWYSDPMCARGKKVDCNPDDLEEKCHSHPEGLSQMYINF